MGNRTAAQIIAALSLTAVLLLAGCSRAQLGSIDDLTVVKYRYIMDDSAKVVRVVGEVHNTADLPAPEAEIIVTLRSRTGSQKGQNRVRMPPLEAGETQQFALAVTSHGTINTVDLSIVEPGTMPGEEAAEDDGGDRESDGDEE